MESQTQKQQITDILRHADNVVITTSKDPDIDQIAAAIALAHIINKLGKRADAVVSGDRPPETEFLGTKDLKDKFSGIRDFVISINTSTTEADKLKYVPEGKALNVYITPYNGNYSEQDVSFRYGDFHADAVIALGAKVASELDPEIANQKELLEKSKLINIFAGDVPSQQATSTASNPQPINSAGGLSWHEPNASSVCELLVNVAESLQGDLMDEPIATSLLTGIMAKTEHFTNAATTPKVMTVAAQLMAAGAQQAEILAHLQDPATAKRTRRSRKAPASRSNGEMVAAKEEQLPHHQLSATKSVPPPKPAPIQPPKFEASKAAPKPPPVPVPPPSVQPLTPPSPQLAAKSPPAPPPLPPPQPTSASGSREMVIEPPSVPDPPVGHVQTTVQPQRPTAVGQVKEDNRLGESRPNTPLAAGTSIPPLSHGTSGPATSADTQSATAPAEASPPEPPHMDVEAARKAVEEATKAAGNPPVPGAQPPASPTLPQ